MKLIKEHINEKFIEYSDPIKDMGIGYITFNNLKVGDMIQCIKKEPDVPHLRSLRQKSYYVVGKIKYSSTNKLILTLLPFGDDPRCDNLSLSIKQVKKSEKNLLYWNYFEKTLNIKDWKKYCRIIQEKEKKTFF